jgi:hypothetical protein
VGWGLHEGHPPESVGMVCRPNTLMITVKDDDAAFVWVKEWFLEQKFLTRIRRVDVDTTLRREQLAFIPAQRHHWFWHLGRPFRVEFYRSEEPRGWSSKRSELLTFRTNALVYLTAAIRGHRRRQAVASLLPKRLTPCYAVRMLKA